MIVPTTTEDERLALVAYIASKCGVTPGALVGQMPFEVVAVWQNGQPRGAMLWNNFRTHSVEMSCAGEPGWLTRSTVKFMFEYPFAQLGVQNVLVMCERRNAKSRSIVKRLGFRELCTIEHGMGSGADTVLYAMNRGRCGWLQKRISVNERCTQGA